MRGMIFQKNFLDSLLAKEDAKRNMIEKQIKIMVCDILITFLQRRTNYLVSNFIAWYETLTKKYDYFDEINMNFEIEEDFTLLLPKIMKSGIEILDSKYEIKDENDLNLNKFVDYFGGKLQSMLGSLNLLQNDQKQYKLKKFRQFTKEKEVPDLDLLLTGQDNTNITKTFLPSLIVSFYLNEDYELNKKLLELLTKCFNQRFELSLALKDLELLFGDSDIEIYNFTQNKIQKLRPLLENSEVFCLFIILKKKFFVIGMAQYFYQ